VRAKEAVAERDRPIQFGSMPPSTAATRELVVPQPDAPPPQRVEAQSAQRSSLTPVRALSLTVPVLLGIACSVWFITFTLDDPWVTFRYAWQLAHGHGLVFNPGEHVEGYTNFLWTVIMTGVIKLGGDPLIWAKVIGIALQSAAVAGVWWCARRMLSERIGLSPVALDLLAGLAATTYAIFFFAAMWSAAALETPLFTALLVAALAAFLTRRLALAAVVLFLAAITRPEGLLLFGAFAVVVLLTEWRGHRLSLRTAAAAILPFAAPFAAFVAWRVAYYGSLLPNTYYDKTGGSLAENLDKGLAYAGSFAANLVGIADGVPQPQFRVRNSIFVLLALAAVGLAAVLYAAWVRRRGVALALAWLITNVLYAVYEGGDWMPVYRFLVPAMPFLVLAAWAVVGEGYRAIATRGGPRRRPLAVGLVGVAALAALGASSAQVQATYAQIGWLRPVTEDHDIRPNDSYFALAQWLHSHLAPGSLVAIEEAGLVPYFNEQLSFLDLFGLTDKHLARAPGEPPFGKQDNTYVLSRAPRYAVLWIIKDGSGTMTWAPHLSLLEDPRFRAQYVRIGVVPRGAGSDFWIFERSGA